MAEQMLNWSVGPPLNGIRIVIAAEQALFREGVRSLLESEWQGCAIEEAETTLEVSLRIVKLRPDLLILDSAIPAFPTPDVLQAVAVNVPVIVLWDERDRPDHEALRRSGVRRWIDKRLGAGALLDAIRSVLMSASNHHRSEDSEAATLDPNPDFHLTRREGQILVAVASGLPNKEIAQRLAITEDTVKRHLTSIFDKLGVSNRVELTLFAVHHGLVDDSLSLKRPMVPFRPSRSPRRVIWRDRLAAAR